MFTLLSDDVFEEVSCVLAATMSGEGGDATDLDWASKPATQDSSTGYRYDFVAGVSVEHKMSCAVFIVEYVSWVDALFFYEDCFLDGATVFEDAMGVAELAVNGFNAVILIGHDTHFVGVQQQVNYTI